MSKELLALMVKLASDVDYLVDFVADPAALLTESGLSEEDQNTVLSGNQNLIYGALSGQPLPPGSEAPPLQTVTIPPNVTPTIAVSPGAASVAVTTQQSPASQQVQGMAAQGWPQAYYYYYPYGGVPGEQPLLISYPIDPVYAQSAPGIPAQMLQVIAPSTGEASGAQAGAAYPPPISHHVVAAGGISPTQAGAAYPPPLSYHPVVAAGGISPTPAAMVTPSVTTDQESVAPKRPKQKRKRK